MTIDEIRKEIARVQTAMYETKSRYLRNDYAKYLHKLETLLKEAKSV